MNDRNHEIKEVVKAKYNEVANASKGCCSGNSDCSNDITFIGEEYSNVEGHFQDADLGLGCGLPTKESAISPGNVVVDLGSGAGNDAFVARQLVGETGQVIGVDMAEKMVSKAIQNNRKLGYTNVEFRMGEIEDLPIDGNSADVVISNCVFNLVPDKSKAFDEVLRILKPGGHFAISDIVTTGNIPESLRQSAELYVGCVAGAIDESEYLEVIRNAGFNDVHVAKRRRIDLEDMLKKLAIDDQQVATFAGNRDVGVFSITVVAYKP